VKKWNYRINHSSSHNSEDEESDGEKKEFKLSIPKSVVKIFWKQLAKPSFALIRL
jgi:hypothetical protein